MRFQVCMQLSKRLDAARQFQSVPSRLSMTNKRMRNLAFLAFESKRIKISFDTVLRKFDDAKERKVQLF